MLFIILQIDKPQPQRKQQIIVGFRPELSFKITSFMAEIGGFRTKGFFLMEVSFVFAFFALSLTLSVAVCHRIQQVL